MELNRLRLEIDKIDTDIIDLFARRMDVAKAIGEYKKEHGMRSLDPARERQKLADVAAKSREDMAIYTQALFNQLFELSKLHQNKLLEEASEDAAAVEKALETTPKMFPSSAVVACQGIEGANSQAACCKIFQTPDIKYFKTFEGVFKAIENGICSYGVIPIENSTAGSVTQVYDLMRSHNFKIVRSCRLKIDHTLLAKNEVDISHIREIISHPQAISQCEEFLSELEDVKITQCENTAVAAKIVSESERDDIACLSSDDCADIYGLNILKRSVQDSGSNYTRFICISKNLEVYPGADKTSVMLVTKHQPGSLYHVLGKFYAMGINLLKLESRPIPESDFEFMFYFDLKVSVYSPEFAQLLYELENACDEFRYLGSYIEVVE